MDNIIERVAHLKESVTKYCKRDGASDFLPLGSFGFYGCYP